MPLHPLTHCGICQSQKVHIYSDIYTQTDPNPNQAPNQDPDPLMAVCLSCGSHYLEPTGWLDAADL